MTRRWRTITVTPPSPDQRLILEAWLVEQGLPGWEEVDGGFRYYLSPEDVARRRLADLHESVPDGTGWHESDTDEEDWAEGWKQYFKPTRLTPSLAVCPTWDKWEGPAEVKVIRMDPGMAFGTGGHATTRLCLELVERHLVRDGVLLDVGTGSGILAIGALLLGMRQAVCIDNDPLCVEVCRENLDRNGVLPAAEVLLGNSFEPVQGRQFDLVVANLVTVALLDIAPEIVGLLRPNGIFVGSGTTFDRVPEVMRALQAGRLAVLESCVEGEWAAVAASKLSG